MQYLKSVIFILVFTLRVQGQRVYKNGNLQTGTVSKSGVSAPVGYFWSEVQNNAGNTTESNASGGFSANLNTASLSDDFVVPVGQTWALSKLSFFGYQTGSSGNPFNQLFIKVYDAPPNAGGNVIFGDFVTNRISGVFDSKIYRIFNSSVPASGSTPGTSRLIWKISADVSFSLPSGTYWVEWTIKAVNNSSVFCPSSTIIGQRLPWSPPVANALQNLSGSWALANDVGNPSSAPDVNVEFPFEIEYTTNCPSTVNINNSINFNDVKAQNLITTAYNISNSIPTSANVTFQAGKSITLNPGFKTSNDAIFTAKILGNCL